MTPFSASFALHESQGLSSFQALSESMTQQFAMQSPPFIALTYPKQEKDQARVVANLLRAIIYCYQKKIPLLLNRTGEQLDVSDIQQGFSIGLQTSGTTGKPKWVFSTFESLLPKHETRNPTQVKNQSLIWMLCYHPFSFAGLQVILQTLIGGNTLCAFPHLSASELALAICELNVSAISCTPSLLRTLNLTWGNNKPPLQRLSLGGEIATQSILDEAKQGFPKASLRHIYATTESGVLFSVKDGLAGFPESWLHLRCKEWELSLEHQHLILTKANKRIDTGDRISIENGRCLFAGRSDNIINVGGAKVDALVLENQILELEAVIDARVFAKPNPIVGNVIAVEILTRDKQISELALTNWKRQLASIQQPRLIKWVDHIQLSETGKKLRVEQ